MTKRYVGFYLTEGLWADKKPDYSKFNSQYWLVPEFTKLMDEAVIRAYDDDKEIVIYRDGLITYHDEQLNAAEMSSHGNAFQRIEKYTEILNAISAILISEITKNMGIKYHTHFEITHHDISGITFEDGNFSGMGIPTKSTAASQINKRFLSMTPANLIDCLDLYLDSPPRPVVPGEILEDAVKLYFKLSSEKDNNKLLARANKSAAEFAGTSFSDCVLISWLPVETHLYASIRIYMDAQNSRRFNRDRKDHVLKDFTVSEIIEILEFATIITKEEYLKLHEVRKIRNKIIHDGYSATIDDGVKSLELLESIIKEKTSADISLNTGISMQLF